MPDKSNNVFTAQAPQSLNVQGCQKFLTAKLFAIQLFRLCHDCRSEMVSIDTAIFKSPTCCSFRPPLMHTNVLAGVGAPYKWTPPQFKHIKWSSTHNRRQRENCCSMYHNVPPWSGITIRVLVIAIYWPYYRFIQVTPSWIDKWPFSLCSNETDGTTVGSYAWIWTYRCICHWMMLLTHCYDIQNWEVTCIKAQDGPWIVNKTTYSV